MIARAFVDTNVLVCSRDAGEPVKQPIALCWLRHLWETRAGRVSAQVLNEYYVVVTQKLQPGLPREVARSDLEALATWKPLAIDWLMIQKAWAVEARYRLPWWDSLIVAAAQVSGCALLLSEDFQDDQVFGSVRVVNPYTHRPESMLN